MGRLRKTGIRVIGVLLPVLVACQQPVDLLPEERAAAITDSVSHVMQRFTAHADSAKWDSLGMFYSESSSFRFFESGVLQYGSAQAVRDALAELPAGTRVATEYNDLEIQALAPGLALVTAGFETTFTGNGTPGFSYQGVVTLVWTNEGGTWRILSGHSSVPVPRGG